MAQTKKETVTQVVETSEDLEVLRKTRSEVTLNQAEASRRALLKHYKEEPKVSVAISPHYADAFGRVMQISINGITIWVSVDGKTYQLPETFATEVKARIYAQDKMLMRGKAMANIPQNYEASPGEIQWFEK